MFVGITNTPRDYAWGSRTEIASLLGREASGGPEAELWFGAHPGSPSVVTRASPDLVGQRLDRLVADRPAALLGPGRDRMPFLLKVLAANSPLSLQVHPDAEQAREGFARENEARVKVDAPERNYRDDSDKPEMILALSPTFEALAGFRHTSEARLMLSELLMFTDGDDRAAISAFAEELAGGDPGRTASTGSSRDVIFEGMPDSGVTAPHHSAGGNALHDVVERLLRGGEGTDRLVSAVVSAARKATSNSSFGREWATVGTLADDFPGDPGIVISLLLNRISLSQGQAIALPAGVVHAYLEGTGIELMSASDNVLRGGLTSKHVDIDELLRVVTFEASSVPRLHPMAPAPGITAWQPEVGDFVLAQVALGDAAEVHGYTLAGPQSTAFDLSGPAIVLVVAGAMTVRGAQGETSLARGDAAFVTPDEGTLTMAGSGLAFVATTP